MAGRWPNRRPFRRAARWDGAFPTHRDVGFDQLIPLDELRSIRSYVLEHRPDGAGPFDLVMEGSTPADGDRGAAVVAPYEAVGLTWWVERLGWFRGSIDEMRARVDAGPPALA